MNVNTSATVHVIMDVNGYFSDTLGNPVNYLLLTNDNPGFATAFFHNSTSVNNSSGVYGLAGPSFPRPSNYVPAGVRGEGVANGVAGISQQIGVAGSLLDGLGNEQAFGILGYRLPFSFAGVYGQVFSGSGVVGVQGDLGNHIPIGAVYGISSFGAPGVLGYGGAGVLGRYFTAPDSFGAAGSLGHSATTGVYSEGNAHVQGTFTATNNKGFVQPHPHDASKEIRYISLEGPHTEVYFRGTSQVSQGVSRIPIPEHFRFVADPVTYSTLVTPVGAMATVAVVSEGPEGIVVQASRNVKVHYVVYAEREAVRNPDPIIENVHFRSDPDGKLSRSPARYLPTAHGPERNVESRRHGQHGHGAAPGLGQGLEDKSASRAAADRALDSNNSPKREAPARAGAFR